MLFDLAVFSPEERQTYQDLGRRFEPEDAIAQADSTLSALSGATLELMAQDFLLEDQTTLRIARHQLDEIYRGGGEGPVDPDAVPVLVGLVMTLAREANKAALEVVKAEYSASESMKHLTLTHLFRMVAKPKEGTEPPLKEAGSPKEMFALMAADGERVRALRELRRERQREQSRSEPVAEPAEDQTAALSRAAPKGRKASSKKRDAAPPAASPERIAWKKARDACKEDRSEHGRTALKSAGLLAFGFGGLVLAGERDSEQHTKANSKLAAMGAILTLVAFFSLMRALVRLVMVSVQLGKIKRREPASRR